MCSDAPGVASNGRRLPPSIVVVAMNDLRICRLCVDGNLRSGELLGGVRCWGRSSEQIKSGTFALLVRSAFTTPCLHYVASAASIKVGCRPCTAPHPPPLVIGGFSLQAFLSTKLIRSQLT